MVPVHVGPFVRKRPDSVGRKSFVYAGGGHNPKRSGTGHRPGLGASEMSFDFVDLPRQAVLDHAGDYCEGGRGRLRLVSRAVGAR